MPSCPTVSPVRVTRVIAVLEPGGAQLGALRLSRALDDHGVQTRLLAGFATPEGVRIFRERGVAVEAWNEDPGLQYRCSARFSDWLGPRLADADLVHAHMFGAWWAAACAIGPGTPLVASEHNAMRWPGRPHLREMRSALARVGLFFAHGPAARALALSLGLPPRRLREGVSPVVARAVSPAPWFPRPRLVFAGRLHHEKGPDVLVEAVAALRSAPPTFLVGAGPLEPQLRARVCELGLEAVVHLPGWRDDPAPWVAGASACVVPSRHDAWSQTAVLALGLGVPVIAAAVEGLPALLGDGRGILVPAEDPDALAGAIGDVLAGRVRTDLPAGRALASRFTPARVAARYAAAYRELLADRADAEPAELVAA